MSTTSTSTPLSGDFRIRPHPDGVRVSPAVEDLVVPQVQALLRSSPAYYRLSASAQRDMERNLTKIAAYSAALLQDGFGQADRIGQTPVLRRRTLAAPPEPVARAAAQTDFSTRATDQVARITRDTLNAIDFPTFVADLIRGTYDAIVTASIKQMEAYGELLANVAKTVDQFMADNITDNQARDYLASRYPNHLVVDTSGGAPQVRVRDGSQDLPQPDLHTDLGVPEGVEIDDSSVEEVLVPAARRQLAQSRHQVLSTMVLMGINRIIVTSGRVRAKVDFHIDAHDTGRAESASQFDLNNETSAHAGWFGWGAETKTTVAYVQTAKQLSTDEVNVEVDLTGELDLKFRSETFPLERFADSGLITRIQSGTANPAGNPVGGAPSTPARE